MPEREYNPNRKPITNRTFELTPQSLYYLRRLQEITGEREGVIIKEALCALYLGLTRSKHIEEIRAEIDAFRKHSYSRPFDKKRRKIIDDPYDIVYEDEEKLDG
jgi:hypothetical protein